MCACFWNTGDLWVVLVTLFSVVFCVDPWATNITGKDTNTELTAQFSALFSFALESLLKHFNRSKHLGPSLYCLGYTSILLVFNMDHCFLKTSKSHSTKVSIISQSLCQNINCLSQEDITITIKPSFFQLYAADSFIQHL